ncbi:UNVERIFIED_CONTAM: hypothetical protein GTU68_045760 [Idotea baltica]|nr:hypothetical protein [Idotea baltica]
MGAEGPETVSLADKTAGRKVVIFAVPGAFTPTCHSAHVPSFIRTKSAFDDKGVDEIICVSVNDPFVMKAWGDATGAEAAGLTMLSDPESAFTKGNRNGFDAPPAGLNRPPRAVIDCWLKDGDPVAGRGKPRCLRSFRGRRPACLYVRDWRLSGPKT